MHLPHVERSEISQEGTADEVILAGGTSGSSFPNTSAVQLAAAGRPERRDVQSVLPELLPSFVRQLNRWLQQPFRVEILDSRRRIVVFDTVAFTVHGSHKHQVKWVELPEPFEGDIQIWPFMSRSEWRELLAICLQRHAACRMPPIHPALHRRVQRWIVATALRRISLDERFRHLRQVGVIEAFGLDPALVRIALRSRDPGESGALSWRHLQLVWSREAAFRRVAAEVPHLLSLVAAGVRAEVIPVDDDAVQALARHISREVSPRAWRFVAKHGARALHTPWRCCWIDLPMDLAIGYLHVMAAANWPPPPPPRVLRAWLRRAGMDLYFSPDDGDGWLRPHVLACASRLADATRTNRVHRPSTTEFLRVAEWAHDHLPEPSRAQRAGAWCWLERQCRKHEERQRIAHAQAPEKWHTLVGTFTHDKWIVEPLVTAQQVIAAKLALRNCLDRYVERARCGSVRLFVIREPGADKPVGVVGIRVHPGESRCWVVLDVRGFANREAPLSWHRLAACIASRYTTEEFALRDARPSSSWKPSAALTFETLDDVPF